MQHTYGFRPRKPEFSRWLLAWLLFASLGVVAQPTLVKDINPGAASSNPAASAAVINGIMYFSATTAANGTELWRSDGTTAGTVLVKDINPGTDSSFPSGFVNFNGLLYFTANDGTSGSELWKSDGTAAGTVRVLDLIPGPGSVFVNELTVVNGALYFATSFSGSSPATSFRIFRSDGTAAGTAPVEDPAGLLASGARRPALLEELNGNLIFTVLASGSFGSIPELWRSDGTTAGTTRLADRVGDPGELTSDFTRSGNKLFFTSFASRQHQVWQTDGISAGILVGGGTRLQATGGLTDVNGTLFFVNLGTGLYKSEGTSSSLVKSFPSGGPGPARLTNVNGTLFFVLGNELYKSDGTNAGTVPVRSFSAPPSALANMNGTLYLSATGDAGGVELWKSDGTAAGTIQVGDINPGAPDSNPARFVTLNNLLLFSATNVSTGTELWKVEPAAPVTTFRLNAGGGAFAASDNRAFSADNFVTEGNFHGISGSDILNTTDDELYHSERWGSFSYNIPVTSGSYQVVLHFAEIWWGTSAAGTGGAGSRKFNVDIEGSRKLTEYDIFAKAGGALRAIQETFQVTVTDGILSIDFLNGSADNAKVSAIEVVPADSGIGSGYYTLKARHSGKVLDVSGESTDEGAAIIQYALKSPLTGNQVWQIEPAGEGYYTLTATHSGKVLDVPGGSTDEETAVIQYQANGGLNQQWQIELTTDGYYKLTARHSGKALQVAGASPADGALIGQGTFTGADHQQWQLEVVPVPARQVAQSKPAPGDASLRLYPNPVQDQLTVRLPFAAGQVRGTAVVDAVGKLQLQNLHRMTGERELVIPVTQLKQGLYLLRLDTQQGSRVVRFLRQ